MLDKISLEYTAFKTALGWVAVLASPDGLQNLVLPQANAEKAISLLEVSGRAASKNAGRFHSLEERLQEYFCGHKVEFPDSLDLGSATVFRRRVWLATQFIPYGSIQSYGWLASRIGQPEACRAVGQALGKNPLPVIIPCHRVLTSSHKPGGFHGGTETKLRLLRLEGQVI